MAAAQAPERDGLVPEWAPQSGVQLTWPHDRTDWREILPEAERCFATIAREIARREDVLVVCRDEDHRRHVLDVLVAAGTDPVRIRTAIAPSNDTWARDHGPITVRVGGRLRLRDFRFNGWGGKFVADLDDALTGALAAAAVFGDVPRDPVDLVLEGGSIETDGRGSLLTTERCLLTPTRNPALDRAGVEAAVRRWLGVERVLWLAHGELEGDDTDAHVDTLARFCDEHTIAYQSCDDPADSHHAGLTAMGEELRALRDADGAPYRLVPLPFPRARYDEESGRRLPATYANFLVVNGAVLVPTYADPGDGPACAALASCFPGREVVPIDCRTLVRWNGSLHCVTMQLPADVLPPRRP